MFLQLSGDSSVGFILGVGAVVLSNHRISGRVQTDSEPISQNPIFNRSKVLQRSIVGILFNRVICLL